MYRILEISVSNGEASERPYACYDAETLKAACAWHLSEWRQFKRAASLALKAPDGTRYSVNDSIAIVNAEQTPSEHHAK